MEIQKVRLQGRQKILGIPIKSDIQPGDFVKIIKIKDEDEPTPTRESPTPTPPSEND